MKIRTYLGTIVLAASIIGVGCTAPACATKLQVQTPDGAQPADQGTKNAYTADQVVIRLQELQIAAMQAEDAGKLDRNTTRTIVTFTTDAARTLKATPGGWYPTVSKAWEQAKRDVPQASLPQVQVYWSAVDIALASFAPR